MAQHRHKRETNARRIPRAIQIAGPLAIAATAGAVSLGVLTSNPVTGDLLATSASGSISAAGQDDTSRSVPVSRSESRMLRRSERRVDPILAAKEAREDAARATAQAIRRADTRLWTTTELNLWDAAGAGADQVGVLDGVEKVLVTGRRENGRTELVVDGKSRWVSVGYLSDEKPETEPTLGGDCTNGSSVSGGANVVGVHRAVCAAFPDITSYGTYRGDGEHAQGLAIDIMVSGERGWEVAEFLRSNYAALGISYIIYSQNIWSVERGGEGWRSMSDRGSTTANHYDHVHVTTY